MVFQGGGNRDKHSLNWVIFLKNKWTRKRQEPLKKGAKWVSQEPIKGKEIGATKNREQKSKISESLTPPPPLPFFRNWSFYASCIGCSPKDSSRSTRSHCGLVIIRETRTISVQDFSIFRQLQACLWTVYFISKSAIYLSKNSAQDFMVWRFFTCTSIWKLALSGMQRALSLGE